MYRFTGNGVQEYKAVHSIHGVYKGLQALEYIKTRLCLLYMVCKPVCRCWCTGNRVVKS